jgi:hypothetical protein
MMGTTVNARKGNLMRPILRPTLVLLALLVGRLDGQENPAEGTFDGQPAAFWIGQLASEDEHDDDEHELNTLRRRKLWPFRLYFGGKQMFHPA